MSESHSGERATGIDSTSVDKDSSVCPTCGDELKSPHGMKVHHKLSHGESLATVTTSCSQCGGKIELSSSRFERSDKHFCDAGCYGNYISENYTGEDSPKWNQVVLECDFCGSEYHEYPDREERSSFCSYSCRGKYYQGERHAQYESITVECSNCGQTLHRQPHRIERSDHQYCDVKCHMEHKDISGEHNPNWMGGGVNYYGKNWQEMRSKALDRDNHTCQVCGVHESDCSRSLSVHHIFPKRRFIDDSGDYDHESGNALINLISLCRSCHHEWEGLYLRPDPRPVK